MADAAGTRDANPLLAESSLPSAAPRFDRIEPDHFLPAFRQAIAEARSEIEAIAGSPEPPGFDNVIAALERAGESLARVRRIFWTLASASARPEIQAIEAEVSAMLTRHGTWISHHAALFARIEAVREAAATKKLGEAERRLAEDSWRGFVDGGAGLDAPSKSRFAAIDEELSALSTRFGQNVLAAAASWEMLLDEEDLIGLPEPMRLAAARRSEARGHDGKYLLTLDRGDVEGFLAFSNRRDLRERIWRAFTSRCDGGPNDNRPVVNRILALRREKAGLLGHSCYADFALSDSMAKTPDAAMALMMRVWRPALRRAAAEQAELQALAEADGETFALAPWDWPYYAERVRRDRYALDGGEVKKHLTLDEALGAAFAAAGRLYGLSFAPRADLPGWHSDVQAWEVTGADTGTDGAPVGLLYTDYFARAEKHGGAWMGSLRVQERLDGPVRPIVYLVANFAKPPAGSQAGLSIAEARTLFHEFGHALHALLSDTVYPSQAGTAVARDFVEFPSKFMEHWIVAPETLVGLGLPPPLIEAIGHADDFGQGFATVEFLASAIVDLQLHRSAGPIPDAAAAAAAILAEIGMPATIAPRHGLTHFTHVFDGGYASRYYSYLWSEVLDADAFEAFTERGDLYDSDLAARFRREILAPGNSRDPMLSFVAFRGRAPDEGALLRERRLG